MKKKIFTIALVILMIVLILGNPSERQFLNRLQNDYGSAHHGMQLSQQALLDMGKTSYKSYLFWSSYRYSFGNIEVTYFGIAFMKFHLGSGTPSTKKPQAPRV